MARKIAFFVFGGDHVYLAHVMMNALEMKDKGIDVKIVVEGTATQMLKELTNPDLPHARLYEMVKNHGILDCVCRACATSYGALEEAESQDLRICDETSGHPSVARYIADGYEIIAV